MNQNLSKGITGPAGSIRPTGWRLALDRAPQFLSVILIFSLPFVTQLQGADPLFPKWAVTQIVVSLMAGAWLLRAALDGEVGWVNSKALWALVVFSAWTGISLFFSPYRAAGLLTLPDYLCFPLWYILLTFTCTELWKAENLLIVFLLSGLGSSLWALSQLFGIGDGQWLAIIEKQFGGRAVAGFGTPNFLAGFLLMVWPMALALLLRAEGLFSKTFWAFLLLTSLGALIETGSVAGWIGFAAGLVVFTFFSRKDPKVKFNFWILLLFFIFAFSLFFSPISFRLKELMDIKNGEVRTQAEVWKGTLEIIRAHPFTGIGIGTFSTAFPAFRPIPLAMKPSDQTLEINHAGNWVLEWMAEVGPLGFFLMLVFWFFALAQWWRLYSANAIPKSLAAGFFAVLTCIAVDNFFDMNNYQATTRIPLLFLAAFPVALSQRFYHMPGFPIRYKRLDLSGFRIYLLPVFVVAIAVLFRQVATAFERQMTDVKLKKAAISAQEKRWPETISDCNEILQLEPKNYKARYLRASAYSDQGKLEDLEKALWDFNTVERVEPDYYFLHLQKALVLKRLNRLDESAEEMKRAIQLDPLITLTLEEYKTAGKLATDKRFDDALNIYQKLILDYPNCVPLLESYANCLRMDKKFPEAFMVFKQVLTLYPEDPFARDALHSLDTSFQH
jgi:tetratricopeptide (TPR) repeat protein